MSTKDYIIIGLIMAVMAMIFLIGRPVGVEADTRRILDSIRYEQKMDSLYELMEVHRLGIIALENENDSLTLQLELIKNARRTRRPSRIGSADSLRTAILREAGIVQPR